MGAKRRGRGDHSIYFDHEGTECSGDTEYHRHCKGRWRGAISKTMPDGSRIRRKVSGRNKTAVSNALKDLDDELDRGLNTSGTYTVSKAVADWLEGGLPGRSDRTQSIYREATGPLLELIGSRPLRDLTAGELRTALTTLSTEHSTRYLQLAHASVRRTIRYAEAHDISLKLVRVTAKMNGPGLDKSCSILRHWHMSASS